MSRSSSQFEAWAQAQAAAIAAERALALAATQCAEGNRDPPTPTEKQHALILRGKATALLMAVVSEAGPADGGITVTPPKPPLPGIGA